MKVLSLILLLLLLICAAGAVRFMTAKHETVRREDAAFVEPRSPIEVVPVVAVEEPPVVAMEPSVADPIQVPVQPLEERGDAMLFEIDALGGLPFDQSITMPFD